MEPTKILPIVAVLSLVSVEYGGWALLTYISGRAGLADWQKGFFRAGHAHAGVLLVLSLVYLLYLPRAEFSDGFEWIAGGVLIAGVLAQSGGLPLKSTARFAVSAEAEMAASFSRPGRRPRSIACRPGAGNSRLA
jgi:hypothetical protein